MIALSGQYANALAELGVKQGDRVAVQTQKYKECFWLYLACLRIGAIYLPLNSAYTTAEIEYFAGDAEPVLFVCDPDRMNDLAAMLSGLGIGKVETLDARGTEAFPSKPDKCLNPSIRSSYRAKTWRQSSTRPERPAVRRAR